MTSKKQDKVICGKKARTGSYVLKSASSDAHLLELTEVVVVVDADESDESLVDDPEMVTNRKGSLKKKPVNDNDDDFDLRNDLKLCISTFKSHPSVNPLILLSFRLLILSLAGYLMRSLHHDFHRIIGENVLKEQAAGMKGHHEFVKIGMKFCWAAINADRCLMLIFLGTFLPLLSICYAYLVAFLVTLRAWVLGGADELEHEIWGEILENNKREKGLLIRMVEGCAARLDCTLGYAFTLPILSFLSLFNSKTIPLGSIYLYVLLIFLVVCDELMIVKGEIEVEAVFNVLKMNGIIGVLGISWIFFIRLLCADHLPNQKFHTTLSEDLRYAIFLSVLFFTAHCFGCALKYWIRRGKSNFYRTVVVGRSVEGKRKTSVHFDISAGVVVV